jgi:hypothetical protein
MSSERHVALVERLAGQPGERWLDLAPVSAASSSATNDGAHTYEAFLAIACSLIGWATPRRRELKRVLSHDSPDPETVESIVGVAVGADDRAASVDVARRRRRGSWHIDAPVATAVDDEGALRVEARIAPGRSRCTRRGVPPRLSRNGQLRCTGGSRQGYGCRARPRRRESPRASIGSGKGVGRHRSRGPNRDRASSRSCGNLWEVGRPAPGER